MFLGNCNDYQELCFQTLKIKLHDALRLSNCIMGYYFLRSNAIFSPKIEGMKGGGMLAGERVGGGGVGGGRQAGKVMKACSDSQSPGQVVAGSRLLLNSCGAMHTKM